MRQRDESEFASECNEDPVRFDALGYCIFHPGLPEEVVARYSRDLDAKHAAGGFKGEPHYYYPQWRHLCRNSRILDAVASILGPELVLFYSSAFVKRPRDGKHVDWHQDNTYWSTVTGHDVVTVWLALDDVDEGNACMQVIPGSHRGHDEKSMKEVADMNGAMLSHEVDVTEAEIASAIPLVLNAGAFSIHDSFLLHGSGPNDSDRRRAGYTIRYGNALTTAIRQAEHRYGNHPSLPVYYVRGSGAGMGEGYVDVRSNGSWAMDDAPWT